jgi:hypothetical protein
MLRFDGDAAVERNDFQPIHRDGGIVGIVLHLPQEIPLAESIAADVGHALILVPEGDGARRAALCALMP